MLFPFYPERRLAVWAYKRMSRCILQLQASFPAAFVGGRVRPHIFSDDPFSSHVPSWGIAPGADSEAAPMAPLKKRCSYFLDVGPRSDICGEDLAKNRRRYAIPSSIGIRNPSEFECAPDGETNEVAVYEAYLKADMRNGIPSLVAEIISYFSFSPSQLTLLTWITLMAVQVLRELHDFSIGCTRSCSPITLPHC